jgi:hypothetical protein
MISNFELACQYIIDAEPSIMLEQINITTALKKISQINHKANAVLGIKNLFGNSMHCVILPMLLIEKIYTMYVKTQ